MDFSRSISHREPASLSSEGTKTWKELLPQVYNELRAIARARMQGERRDHTLQPTALVHETYVRLAASETLPFRDEKHFMCLAGRVMEEVLIDYARSHGAAKRNHGRPAFPLDESRDFDVLALPPDRESRIEDLAEALQELEKREAIQGKRKAEAVRLHYLLGLSNPEAAASLEVSVDTLKRDLRFARAWLRRQLEH